MSEQYILIHNNKVQLDTPGQIDLQVTLESEFDWFEYKENISVLVVLLVLLFMLISE